MGVASSRRCASGAAPFSARFLRCCLNFSLFASQGYIKVGEYRSIQLSEVICHHYQHIKKSFHPFVGTLCISCGVRLYWAFLSLPSKHMRIPAQMMRRMIQLTVWLQQLFMLETCLDRMPWGWRASDPWISFHEVIVVMGASIVHVSGFDFYLVTWSLLVTINPLPYCCCTNQLAHINNFRNCNLESKLLIKRIRCQRMLST